IAQFEVLRRQAPLVYATVIVETLSIAYVLPATLPWLMRFIAVGVFVPVSIWRLVQWQQQRAAKAPVDAETARAALIRARRRALIMGIGSTIWALVLYEYVDSHTRILATLLVFVGSMGCAYCLASVPSAARLNLLVSTVPLALRLMM